MHHLIRRSWGSIENGTFSKKGEYLSCKNWFYFFSLLLQSRTKPFPTYCSPLHLQFCFQTLLQTTDGIIIFWTHNPMSRPEMESVVIWSWLHWWGLLDTPPLDPLVFKAKSFRDEDGVCHKVIRETSSFLEKCKGSIPSNGRAEKSGADEKWGQFPKRFPFALFEGSWNIANIS